MDYDNGFIKQIYNSDGLRQWIHIAEGGGLVVAQ